MGTSDKGLLYDRGEIVEIDWGQYLYFLFHGFPDDVLILRYPVKPENEE